MIEVDRFTFSSQALNEADLKAIVIDQLRRDLNVGPCATIANEYRLGSTPVRVDIAALSETFIGIEVKSSRDSLRRLPHQMAAYTSYFERVILAVADCHLRNLDWKSLRSVEIWSISDSGRVRVASLPTQMAECRSLGELLTADQCQRYNLSLNSSDNQFTGAFRAEFRKRFGETSDAFWSAVKGRKIVTRDLEILSRFRERRLAIEDWSETQDREWNDWATQVATLGS